MSSRSKIGLGIEKWDISQSGAFAIPSLGIVGAVSPSQGIKDWSFPLTHAAQQMYLISSALTFGMEDGIASFYLTSLRCSTVGLASLPTRIRLCLK